MKRVPHVEVIVPIVYGSLAFWLGKKADEFHSHKWMVYVRSATNDNLAPLIKKVVFQLHESFPNPTRVVDTWPFELHESGWGEFEIGITIHFHSDTSDKPLDPVELSHNLKLYHDDDAQSTSKKPVLVEQYDEIVFSEPSPAFFARIRALPAVRFYSDPPQALAAAIAAAGPPPPPGPPLSLPQPGPPIAEQTVKAEKELASLEAEVRKYKAGSGR
eukprot:jgi/Mesen1/1580/ME000134S00706